MAVRVDIIELDNLKIEGKLFHVGLSFGTKTFKTKKIPKSSSTLTFKEHFEQSIKEDFFEIVIQLFTGTLSSTLEGEIVINLLEWSINSNQQETKYSLMSTTSDKFIGDLSIKIESSEKNLHKLLTQKIENMKPSKRLPIDLQFMEPPNPNFMVMITEIDTVTEFGRSIWQALNVTFYLMVIIGNTTCRTNKIVFDVIPPQEAYITQLPRELLVTVFRFCSPIDVISIKRVCKVWNKTASEVSIISVMKQVELSIKQAINDPTKSEGAHETVATIIPIIKNLVHFHKILGQLIVKLYEKVFNGNVENNLKKGGSQLLRKFVDLANLCAKIDFWKIGCPELTTVFGFYKRNITKINNDKNDNTPIKIDIAMNQQTVYLSKNYPNLSVFVDKIEKKQNFQGLEQYLMDVVHKERYKTRAGKYAYMVALSLFTFIELYRYEKNPKWASKMLYFIIENKKSVPPYMLRILQYYDTYELKQLNLVL